jgi:hypothetical protein
MIDAVETGRAEALDALRETHAALLTYTALIDAQRAALAAEDIGALNGLADQAETMLLSINRKRPPLVMPEIVQGAEGAEAETRRHLLRAIQTEAAAADAGLRRLTAEVRGRRGAVLHDLTLLAGAHAGLEMGSSTLMDRVG